MNKTKNKLKSDRLNRASLARACEVNRSAVTRWVRHPSWTFGPGPWDPAVVRPVKAWAESYLQEDRAKDAREDRRREYRPPQPGAAADEPENVYSVLMREAGRRSIVHHNFYFRAIVGLIESFDRLARPFTPDEVDAAMKLRGIKRGDVRMLDWLEQEQVKARDAATTLTLASQEAVDHYFQTGEFQHLTDDLRDDIDEDLSARWEALRRANAQHEEDRADD